MLGADFRQEVGSLIHRKNEETQEYEYVLENEARFKEIA
jgi:hypothetical protein